MPWKCNVVGVLRSFWTVTSTHDPSSTSVIEISSWSLLTYQLEIHDLVDHWYRWHLLNIHLQQWQWESLSRSTVPHVSFVVYQRALKVRWAQIWYILVKVDWAAASSGLVFKRINSIKRKIASGSEKFAVPPMQKFGADPKTRLTARARGWVFFPNFKNVIRGNHSIGAHSFIHGERVYTNLWITSSFCTDAFAHPILLSISCYWESVTLDSASDDHDCSWMSICGSTWNRLRRDSWSAAGKGVRGTLAEFHPGDTIWCFGLSIAHLFSCHSFV